MDTAADRADTLLLRHRSRHRCRRNHPGRASPAARRSRCTGLARCTHPDWCSPCWTDHRMVFRLVRMGACRVHLRCRCRWCTDCCHWCMQFRKFRCSANTDPIHCRYPDLYSLYLMSHRTKSQPVPQDKNRRRSADRKYPAYNYCRRSRLYFHRKYFRPSGCNRLVRR